MTHDIWWSWKQIVVVTFGLSFRQCFLSAGKFCLFFNLAWLVEVVDTVASSANFATPLASQSGSQLDATVIFAENRTPIWAGWGHWPGRPGMAMILNWDFGWLWCPQCALGWCAWKEQTSWRSSRLDWDSKMSTNVKRVSKHLDQTHYPRLFSMSTALHGVAAFFERASEQALMKTG